ARALPSRPALSRTPVLRGALPGVRLPGAGGAVPLGAGGFARRVGGWTGRGGARHRGLRQRRVYGGSWLGAVLKGLGVGVVYLSLWSSVVLGVTVWASRT